MEIEPFLVQHFTLFGLQFQPWMAVVVGIFAINAVYFGSRVPRECARRRATINLSAERRDPAGRAARTAPPGAPNCLKNGLCEPCPLCAAPLTLLQCGSGELPPAPTRSR
jgi:hypothetical protein